MHLRPWALLSASDIYLGGQNRMHLRECQPTLSSRQPWTHLGGIELEQFLYNYEMHKKKKVMLTWKYENHRIMTENHMQMWKHKSFKSIYIVWLNNSQQT